MGANKKNLLEAFRNAGDVPLPQDEQSEENLRPLSPEEERLLAEETRLQADLTQGGKHSWTTELPAMPSWLPYLAGAGLVFVLVMWLTNLSNGGDDVQAAGDEGAPAVEQEAQRGGEESAGIVPAQPRDSDPQAPVSPSPDAGANDTAAAAPPSEEASPLLDKSNAWTVVVITYSRSATSAEDLAWATYDHLLAEGIPVFTPVEIDNKIVVLAGAAPRSCDLADLERRIGSLSGDGRSNIYTGAYAERIDKFIERY